MRSSTASEDVHCTAKLGKAPQNWTTICLGTRSAPQETELWPQEDKANSTKDEKNKKKIKQY